MDPYSFSYYQNYIDYPQDFTAYSVDKPVDEPVGESVDQPEPFSMSTTLNISLRISQSHIPPQSPSQDSNFYSRKAPISSVSREKGIKTERTYNEKEEERPRKISRVSSRSLLGQSEKTEKEMKDPAQPSTQFLSVSLGIPYDSGCDDGLFHNFQEEHSFLNHLAETYPLEEKQSKKVNKTFDDAIKSIKQEDVSESRKEVKSLTEEEKINRRLEKNRISAQASRERKKQRRENLEDTEQALHSIGINAEMSLDAYYRTFTESKVTPLFSKLDRKLSPENKLERYKTHLSQLFQEITSEAIATKVNSEQRIIELQYRILELEVENLRARDSTSSVSDI